MKSIQLKYHPSKISETGIVIKAELQSSLEEKPFLLTKTNKQKKKNIYITSYLIKPNISTWLLQMMPPLGKNKKKTKKTNNIIKKEVVLHQMITNAAVQLPLKNHIAQHQSITGQRYQLNICSGSNVVKQHYLSHSAVTTHHL